MERPFAVPGPIRSLCRTLEGEGYAAHPVGGAVRDLLLGREPGDWDVASSAPPAVTAALFGERARPTGAAHGTVTVDTALGPVEVTTFRREGPYSDGRRPDWVEFVDDLTTDLARRDFTMNAMALDGAGGLIDPFGGADDLGRGVIRTVGSPEVRFGEDGLRLFRAVRFAAQLDLRLGEAEERAILTNPERGERVSAERVRMEVEKGLCAPAPERLSLLFASGLLGRFLDRPVLPALEGLAVLPAAPADRWAGLCAALLNCGAIDAAEPFLRRFHMDRRTLRGALALLPSSEE